MAQVTLDEVKRYCRLDCADRAEDALLTEMIKAAQEFLQVAGVVQTDSARYALAVKALVLHWYDGEQELKPGLQSLICQLKLEGGAL